MSAKVVPVIVSDDARRGAGTDEDPVRVVVQAFTLDGHLVAEFDPCGLVPDGRGPASTAPGLPRLLDVGDQP